MTDYLLQLKLARDREDAEREAKMERELAELDAVLNDPTLSGKPADADDDERATLLTTTATTPEPELMPGTTATPAATPTPLVPLRARVENLTDKQKRDAQQFEREQWSDERPPSEQFTMLPWRVFRSDQFDALGPRTQLLLVQVAHEVYGSNGYISLTRAKLKRRGFHNNAALSAAIKEAVETGFLRVTGSESKVGRRATSYYPTWTTLPGEKAAPNTWAKFPPKSKSKPKAEPPAVRKAA